MDKEQIKTYLLTSKFGKFDYIHLVVPKEVLQIGAPRMVVQYLVSELEIEKSDIKMNTLRSWLFNYRKKGKGILPPISTFNKPINTTIDTQIDTQIDETRNETKSTFTDTTTSNKMAPF